MSIGNYLTALDEQRDALARNLVTMGVQCHAVQSFHRCTPRLRRKAVHLLQ